VTIDTDGSVLTARARTGNQLLHPEAEKAALATRFNRPTIYGKPARALGFVVYRFGRVEDASEEDGGPPREDPNEPVPDHVIDGIINREAIVLPKLGYQLKPGEGGGMVYVSITVDESGNVIEARGDSPYDPVLKSALEKAARGAKFKPRLVRGHPVKVKATLVYELKPGK
jgi:TonB family protein